MIYSKILVLIGFVLFAIQLIPLYRNRLPRPETFRAAVYEHILVGNIEVHSLSEFLQLNLQRYEKAVELAAKEVSGFRFKDIPN